MEDFETAQNEVAPQEITPNLPDQQSVQETDSSLSDSRQDRNWKAARERQKHLERELKMQQEINERLFKMLPQQSPKQEIDELDAIPQDDYLQRGQVEKLVEKRAQRIAQDIAKREVEIQMQQRDQAQFMDRLKSKFSDFDDVVNTETLELLETHEPELAMEIAASKDPYKIGLQSYKYIKALKIADQVPSNRRSKEIDKALEKAKTVQSPQVFEKRPMAQAFKMSETEKKALYEEMYSAASQVGFSY